MAGGLLCALVAAAPFAERASAGEHPHVEPCLEHGIKASHIGRFLRFVYWPEQSGPSGKNASGKNASGKNTSEKNGKADRELQLSIYGADPFRTTASRLEQLEVDGRRVVVRRPRSLAAIPDYSAVFLAVEGERLEAALAALRDRPVLTIGEAPEFLEAGGIIRFVNIQDRVRFEISETAIERSGLELSSRLIRLAVRKPGTLPANGAP